MSGWTIGYSGQAESDLRDIYEYIAFNLKEPGIAKAQVRRIIESVSKLDQMPLRHHLYKNEPWHSKGLRVMRVDNYMVFYLPFEAQKTVAVVRIMYGGRDIDAQLQEADSDK